MKTFMTSVKGKIIAGAATVVTIGIIAAVVVWMNQGYRSIEVEELNGATKITRQSQVSDAYVGQHLRVMDDVAVNQASDMTLALDADKHVFAEENTHFWIEAKGKKDDTKTVIHLDHGSSLYRIDKKLTEQESFSVDTPNATMSVRGTVFHTTYLLGDDGFHYTLIEVLEGEVLARARMENGDYTGEEYVLKPGESALIRSNADFSEFVKDEAGNMIGAIDFHKYSQHAALFLGKAIDEGRILCIEKDLLFDVVDLIEHDFTADATVVEATCTEDGYTTYTCSICHMQGDKMDVVKALGHDFVQTEVSPTCNEEGKITSKCSRCGEATTEILAKTSHKFVEKRIEPTCMVEGSVIKKCEICGEEEKTILPKKDHDFASQTITATCVADGKIIRTCINCKMNEETTVAALGHAYAVTETAPTCVAAGHRTQVCMRCGDRSEEDIMASGHNYAVTLTPATCVENGLEIRECRNCGEKETNVLPKGGHNYIESRKEPTCTEAGAVIMTCSRCNDKKQTVLPKKNHDLKESRKEPTCTVDGVLTTTCTRCTYKAETPIPKLGHDLTETKNNPTCTVAGSLIHTCKRCTYRDETPIPALGHDFSGRPVQSQTQGMHSIACSRCTESKNENCQYTTGSFTGVGVVDVPIHTHSCVCGYSEDIVIDDMPATYEQFGDALQHRIRCSVCNAATEQDHYVDAFGTCERCGQTDLPY